MNAQALLTGMPLILLMACSDSPTADTSHVTIDAMPATLEKRTTYLASATVRGAAVSPADLAWGSSNEKVLLATDGIVTAQDTGDAYVIVWLKAKPSVRDSSKVTVVVFDEGARELSTVLRVFRSDGAQITSGAVSGLIRPIGAWSMPNGVTSPITTRVTWNGQVVCSAQSQSHKGEFVCEMNTTNFANGAGAFRFEIVNPVDNAVMASTSYPMLTIAN